jgi:hypothetical protein
LVAILWEQQRGITTRVRGTTNRATRASRDERRGNENEFAAVQPSAPEVTWSQRGKTTESNCRRTGQGEYQHASRAYILSRILTSYGVFSIHSVPDSVHGRMNRYLAAVNRLRYILMSLISEKSVPDGNEARNRLNPVSAAPTNFFVGLARTPSLRAHRPDERTTGINRILLDL